MNLKKFMATILICVAGHGCNRSREVPDDTVIKAPGNYTLSETGHRIMVSISNHRVKYVVVDSHGIELINSEDFEGHASSLHQWCIGWDQERSYLWVISSDVGDAVWVPDGQGRYIPQWVADRIVEFYPALPERFRNEMSPLNLRQLDKLLEESKEPTPEATPGAGRK
jgi:hypothetical protein